MTEVEWLVCDDPARMLRLITENPDHVNINCTRSERKLRLFACACCRRHRDKTDPAMIDDLDFSLRSLMAEPCEDCYPKAEQAALLRDIFGNPFRPVSLPTCDHCEGKGKVVVPLTLADLEEHERRQRRGGKFHVIERGPRTRYITCFKCGGKSPKCPWLTWNDRTIPRLAQTIYGERSFDLMPILADALEEAGCMNQDILDHCRNAPQRINTGPGDYGDEWVTVSVGPHVRGCWVIDLLLGKE